MFQAFKEVYIFFNVLTCKQVGGILLRMYASTCSGEVVFFCPFEASKFEGLHKLRHCIHFECIMWVWWIWLACLHVQQQIGCFFLRCVNLTKLIWENQI